MKRERILFSDEAKRRQEGRFLFIGLSIMIGVLCVWVYAADQKVQAMIRAEQASTSAK